MEKLHWDRNCTSLYEVSWITWPVQEVDKPKQKQFACPYTGDLKSIHLAV